MTGVTKEKESSSLLAPSSRNNFNDSNREKMDYLLTKVDEMKNKLKVFTEFFSKFSLEVTSSLEVVEKELKILKRDKADKGNDFGSERSFDIMTPTTPENSKNSLTTEENSESDSDENISVGNENNNDFSESEREQQLEVSPYSCRDIKPYILSNEVQKCVDELEISEEFKTENLSIYETPADQPKVSHSTTNSDEAYQWVAEIEVSEEFKSENLSLNEASDNQPKVSHLSIAKSLPENTNLTNDIRCKKSYSLRKSTLRQNLKLHNQTKTAESSLMLLSCDHCEYKTYRKPNLTVHIQSKHSTRDTNVNKCCKCKKSYRYKSSLQKHSKLCGKLGNSQSLFKSNQKSNLVSNIQAKHLPRDANLYECIKCKKTYPNKSSLRYHLKVCGPPKYLNRPTGYLSSDHCTYKNSQKYNLAIHIQSQHSSDTFKCATCGKSFSCQDSLLYHTKYTCKILVAHVRFFCDNCNFKSRQKHHLVNHIQSKHLSDTFKCTACDKSFACKKNLYNHKKYSCKILVVRKRLSCDHCTYRSSQKNNLAIHIQTKHSSDTFKCSWCGKLFACQDNLRKHTKYNCKILVANKRLSCNQCTYQFSHKYQLVYHIQSKHSSDKFKCYKCIKSFSSQYYLNKHNNNVDCKKNK